MEQAKQIIVKPAVSAAVGAVSLPMFIGSENGGFMFRGQEYSQRTLGAVLGATSSLISEVANMAILPHIEKNQRLRQYESLVLSLGSSAGAFALVPKIMNGGVDSVSMGKLALVGLLSEVVSSYIYENTAGSYDQ